MTNLTAQELHEKGVSYFNGDGVSKDEKKLSTFLNRRLPLATCQNQNIC